MPTEKETGPPTILVVDDTFENLQLLSLILRANQYTVRAAADGPTALMLVENQTPDLILLDIRMPEMSGFQVCSRLKSNPKTKDIPVIFLSALDDLEDKLKGFDLGAVDYITKPFMNEEVLARVKIQISLKNMQRQLEGQNIRLQDEIQERLKAEEALKRANDDLERRVQERTAELVKAKEAAEAGNRAKTEFIANVSHEFRTPLNPILGMTSFLMQKTDPKSRDYELLRCMERSGNELLTMIEELIRLSQIEADGLQPRTRSFDVREYMNSIVSVLAYTAKSKGLDVRDRIGETVPDRVSGDMELLEDILLKLGKNAIKFTEKGEIGLEVQKKSECPASVTLQFSISDTGIGIPSSRMDSIFEDFTQADGSKTRKYEGLGLGLTLVRRLVGHLGGELWVESQERKGSTFHFTLPFGLAV